MTKQSKILTGVLAGVAVGAGIALILYKDKDGELRGKVSDWLCDLIDSSKDKIAGVTNVVKDTLSRANA